MDTDNSNLIKNLNTLLPQHYQPHLSSDIDPESVEKIIKHILAVRSALKTYLPRYLVDMVSTNPVPGIVSGKFFNGTVLFADVSGFTAMSEQLSVLGKEGAEEITWIVNSYFTAMIKISEHYGGDLIKFGGDALLVYFGGETSALQALTAAHEMQIGMVDFRSVNTSQGTFPLRMKIGLATGSIFFASLGDKEKMDYTILGKTLSCMANAEGLASAEQIVACDSTRKLTANAADYADLDDGFGRLLKFKLAARDVQDLVKDFAQLDQQKSLSRETLSDLDQDIAVIRAIKPYLPSELFDRVINNPEGANLYGSHRPVSIIFANYFGIEDLIERLGPEKVDLSTQLLNMHYTAMCAVIDRYGGTVNRVDSYNIGNRILALFGALRAHEDDPQRAVRAAMDMNHAVIEVNQQAAALLVDNSLHDVTSKKEIFQQRIGVNSGFVFAGNTGSDTRREYTVMGDQVNMTARLMSISNSGEVITGVSTARRTAGHFQLHERESVKVKGISAPLRNFQVMDSVHASEHRTMSREDLGIFGRERELAIGSAAINRVCAGHGETLAIVGVSGVGKTRLAEEISSQAIIQGMDVYNGSCLSYGKTMPYHPWADILRIFFQLKPNQPIEEQTRLVESGMLAFNQGQWAPILGSAIGLDIPDNQLTQDLDAKLRRQRLLDLTLLLLTERSRINPLVLVIEDVQWADPASHELLAYLIRNTAELPILTLFTSRLDESITDWISLLSLDKIELDHLTDLETTLVVNDLLGGAALPDPVYKLIFEKSSGNPFFIGEIVRTLVETQTLTLTKMNEWELPTEIGDIELPDSIHGLIISRIDRLIATDRRILQVASIIGRIFAFQVLAGVFPDTDLIKILKDRLQYLEQLGITELDPLDAAFYRFFHLTTRDVVYESLPYARRRKLHCSIGEFIEHQSEDQRTSGINLLAHHYYEGHSWQKAIKYNLAAAEHAQREFANETAILACERTLQAANNLGPEYDTNPTRITVHNVLGDIYCLIGEYPHALVHYQLARNLVEHLPSSDKRGLRLAELSRKTAAVYEGMSEFQQAIEWLAQGLILVEDQAVNIETARNYILHAGITYRMGDLDTAEEWCHKTLTLADQLSERESRQLSAQAYYNLGHISTRRGDMNQAVEHCRQSVTIYQEIDDIVGQARAFNNLAIAYTDQGDYPGAESALQKSLAINKRIGNVQEQGFIANNLGNIYLYRGDYQTALQLYQESNTIWKRIGAELPEAVVTSNIAQVYICEADFKNAKQALTHSENLFSAIGGEDFLPELERRWAEYYLGTRENEKALAKANSSLAVARKNEARLDEGISLRIAGEIHQRRAEYEQAEEAYSASLDLLMELESEYEAARSMLALENLADELGRQFDRERLAGAVATFTKLGAQVELRKASHLIEEQD